MDVDSGASQVVPVQRGLSGVNAGNSTGAFGAGTSTPRRLVRETFHTMQRWELMGERGVSEATEEERIHAEAVE
eukprot:1737751-Amphidinium_carterae.1